MAKKTKESESMGATHKYPEVDSLRVVLLTGLMSLDCLTCQLSNEVTGLVYGLLLYFRVHHYELFLKKNLNAPRPSERPPVWGKIFHFLTIRHNHRSNVRAVVLLIQSLWAVLLPNYRT